MGLSILAGIY